MAESDARALIRAVYTEVHGQPTDPWAGKDGPGRFVAVLERHLAQAGAMEKEWHDHETCVAEMTAAYETSTDQLLDRAEQAEARVTALEADRDMWKKVAVDWYGECKPGNTCSSLAHDDDCPGVNAVAQIQAVTLRAEQAETRVLAVQREAVGWEEMARQYARNADYYRGLVHEIGLLFGEEARTADDGSVVEDVLCAKVPELVRGLRAHFATAKREAHVLATEWQARRDEMIAAHDRALATATRPRTGGGR